MGGPIFRHVEIYGLVSRENFSIVVVGVRASSHAAAVVRVGASCGQGVGNGVIVVHPCPQLVPTARRAVHSYSFAHALTLRGRDHWKIASTFQLIFFQQASVFVSEIEFF